MAPGEICPHAARFRSRGSGSKSVTGVYNESFSSFGSAAQRIRNCRGHGVECRGRSRAGRTAAGRRVEICCRLERESRVPVCRLWQPQQHDIVRLIQIARGTNRRAV